MVEADKEMMLTEAYYLVVEDATAELNRLVNAVAKAIHVEITDDGVVTTCDLSKDDLCALAMRIPAQCAYVQSQLNAISLEQAVEGVSLTREANEGIVANFGEKKTVKEKQAWADIQVSDRNMVNAAKRQAIKNIQLAIERADKTYEGIKKVMDLYNRDAWINKKT